MKMAHPGTNPVRSGMDDLIPRPSGSKFNAHTTWPPSRRIVESLSVNGFFRKYPTVNWRDVIFPMTISILGIVTLALRLKNKQRPKRVYISPSVSRYL